MKLIPCFRPPVDLAWEVFSFVQYTHITYTYTHTIFYLLVNWTLPFLLFPRPAKTFKFLHSTHTHSTTTCFLFFFFFFTWHFFALLQWRRVLVPWPHWFIGSESFFSSLSHSVTNQSLVVLLLLFYLAELVIHFSPQQSAFKPFFSFSFWKKDKCYE